MNADQVLAAYGILRAAEVVQLAGAARLDLARSGRVPGRHWSTSDSADGAGGGLGPRATVVARGPRCLSGVRTAGGQGPARGAAARRWARAVCRRPAPGVRTAAARARRDPASTTSRLARVIAV